MHYKCYITNDKKYFKISKTFRYKHYDDQLSKTKASNRENEKEFVAEVNDITPGKHFFLEITQSLFGHFI